MTGLRWGRAGAQTLPVGMPILPVGMPITQWVCLYSQCLLAQTLPVGMPLLPVPIGTDTPSGYAYTPSAYWHRHSHAYFDAAGMPILYAYFDAAVTARRRAESDGETLWSWAQCRCRKRKAGAWPGTGTGAVVRPCRCRAAAAPSDMEPPTRMCAARL